MTAMNNFIEDYLDDPAQAISSARERADHRFSLDCFVEEHIYKEIASPEFRLYEAIIFSQTSEGAAARIVAYQ